VCALGAWPSRGVIAGCTLASTFAKVAVIEGGDQWVLAHPGCTLGIYVDDITMEAEGDSDDAVVAKLGEAALSMSAFVQDDMGGDIALGKAAAITNSPAVLRRLRALLGGLAGKGDGCAAAALGVDLSPGTFRGSLRGGGVKRSGRWLKAHRRVGRLANIAKTLGIGRNPIRFHTAGVSAVVAYDAPVYGLSTTAVARLRRWGAVAMRPKARGRSLTATCLLYGDPAGRPAVAAATQWAREVWRGAANSFGSTSLSMLSQAWRSADRRKTHRGARYAGQRRPSAPSFIALGGPGHPPGSSARSLGESFVLQTWLLGRSRASCKAGACVCWLAL
jgi:hypothetical protein